MSYRSLAIGFVHLPNLCPASGKTHTFTEIDLRLLQLHPEKDVKAMSLTVQKREEKHYRN
jgi:hypothetical protein